MTFLDHEQMRILVLDTKNQVVENINRYQGTVNSPVLRAAEVYRPAIIRNCPGVIITRSGKTRPVAGSGMKATPFTRLPA